MTPDEIFTGDALGRQTFATNLAKHIANTKCGVLAIDGAWGSGKSWFGARLRGVLEEEYLTKCVWIDTFESDWHDDPALSLFSAIAEQLPHDKRTAFVGSIAPLLGKGIVTIAQAGASRLASYVGIDPDVVDKLSDIAKDAGDEYIKKRLEELAEKDKSLAALKQVLSKAVADCGGKVVVFVDELDRCSPAYAIRFLERTKHLFAVDGVVHVLLWNRNQIQQAVKAFYGLDTDGQMYLDKFVDYPCHLPNHHLHKRAEAMGPLVKAEVQSRSGYERIALDDVTDLVGGMADFLSLTAREVKHVCSWYVMPPAKVNPIFEIWLLCLKAKYPDIYAGLINEGAHAHQRAADILATFESNNGIVDVLDALCRLHKACAIKNAGDFSNYQRILFYKPFGSPLTVTSECILRLESIRP